MSAFSIFVDGCVTDVVESDSERNAVRYYVGMEYPPFLGYSYVRRADDSVRVEYQSDESPAWNSDDPYYGRLMVVHAERL